MDPQVSPPSHSKIPLIIGTTLLLGIVGAGIFTLGKRSQTSKKLSYYLSPTPQPNNITDWNTYTNTKFGFSIKYPIGMAVRDAFDPRDNKDDSYIVDFQFPRKSQKDWLVFLSIEVLENPQSLSAQDYFTAKNHNTQPPPSITKEERVTVDGIYSYSVTLNPPNEAPATYTYIPKGNQMFQTRFEVDKGNDPFVKEHTETLNKIVSTFQFTQ